MPKGYFIPLTEDQEQQIRDKYLEVPIKTLAKELGTTFGVITRRLKNWGLEIPKDLVEKRSIESRYNKGHVSANKGLKQEEYMSPEAIERTKATRFKKGRKPHNVKYDGYERKRGDGYIYVRISENNYQLKHKWIWEKENGPVPEGMVIHFKDGNQENCSIENLEIISKTENMIRNSIHNYPEETIDTMVLISKIKKTVKQKTDGKE